MLLGTQVIVQVLALYMAYVYGLLYLLISTFPILWEKLYGESVDIGGLNYIALAIGFFIGTQVCARFNNKVWTLLDVDNSAGPNFPRYTSASNINRRIKKVDPSFVCLSCLLAPF